jgi:Icc-related predicted phosphoesterase
MLMGPPAADALEELARALKSLRGTLGALQPEIFLILGNDDPRAREPTVLEAEREGIWRYAACRALDLGSWRVFGYPCVPPTPFPLKDWERYDVSTYTDPGCTPPDEGLRSVPMEAWRIRHATIARELEALTPGEDLSRSVFLFHAPPYGGPLDLAALDGHLHEGVPLDPHVGSIAIRRFLEARQPLLSLHGHVHESTRLSGRWLERIGASVCIQGAHDGPELALVRLDLERPEEARRELIA